MAKKLNSMPDYQARMPKQPHDLSQSFTFTAPPAMELPVYYDMLHPGDDLHFSNGIFARLQNPQTAPLGDIDFHLDYFFVPLSVIYTPSVSLFYQTDDLVSGIFNDSDLLKDRFPVCNIDSCLAAIAVSGVNGNQLASFKQNVYFDAAHFDCAGKAAYRLCDMLDYSAKNLWYTTGDLVSYNPKETPWFLCAYHACHELYFRNDDREAKNYLYNIDEQYNNTTDFSPSNLFGLHYVSRYKDYFNAIKVSPIGSSVSMLNGRSSWDLLSQVNSYLFNGNYDLVNLNGSNVSSDTDSTTIRGLNQAQALGSLTSSNIRQLFMVDKLLRVTGRANKDYESQFLAHFGIKIPHDVLHNITHIGHDMVSMSAQPVIASANTWNGETGSALGEVGGQGSVSLQGKKFNFNAPCHGVFMVIMHYQPKLRYFSGINKLHDLSDPMKFWQPEYDRKGMQPLFEYETNRDSNIAYNFNRVGWQFAFEQFKRKYDKVSTAFKNIYLEGDSPSVNFYAPWVLATRPYCHPATGYMNHGDNYDFTDFNFTDLLATPHDLDNIMTVTYSTSWITNLQYDKSHLLFQTDPVIIDYHMNCKKVNCMSEFGEPEID